MSKPVVGGHYYVKGPHGGMSIFRPDKINGSTLEGVIWLDGDMKRSSPKTWALEGFDDNQFIEVVLDGELADAKINTAITLAFKKAAELIRKKAKSYASYGWDPSATEDTSARDEARSMVGEALGEVADALEETVSEK
jgi:hypothetical protein